MHTVWTTSATQKGGVIVREAFKGTVRECMTFMRKLYSQSTHVTFEKATIHKFTRLYIIDLPKS